LSGIDFKYVSIPVGTVSVFKSFVEVTHYCEGLVRFSACLSSIMPFMFSEYVTLWLFGACTLQAIIHGLSQSGIWRGLKAIDEVGD
jgi:hypothetical protein